MQVFFTYSDTICKYTDVWYVMYPMKKGLPIKFWVLPQGSVVT